MLVGGTELKARIEKVFATKELGAARTVQPFAVELRVSSQDGFLGSP